MLESGREIERYVVESLLGEGGMAAVYRIRHKQLDVHYALKVLTLTHPQVRERMLREGRVQATLQHPNAVSVLDVLEVDGAPGLVMEFVDGPDLDGWLAENQPDLAQAERIFRGIASGVAAAHRLGIVHRDLKPANVLIALTPEGPVPKVTDFGLAKIVAGESDKLKKTRTGATMGTPGFMAPEQIRDASDVDERADVFALGCILYLLVCGRPPYQDDDLLALYNAVANAQHIPPEELVPDLPPRFRDAIGACLQVDRERRPYTAADVLEALDEQTQVPAPARPPEQAPAAARKSTSAGGAVVAGAAMMGGAVVGGVALLLVLVFLLWPTGEPAEAEAALANLADGEEQDDAPAAALEPGDPCQGAPGELIGYVQVPQVGVGRLTVRPDSVWPLQSDRNVRASFPSAENDHAMGEVLCVLPRGTRLRVDDRPVRVQGYGSWVAVRGGAAELP